MSVVLLSSIIIRIAAVLFSLEAVRRLKDWRIGLFALMATLMALRQTLTLLSRPIEFSIKIPSNYNGLPGLAVSVLVLVSIVFMYRLIRDRDSANAALAAREAQLQMITNTLPVLLSYMDRDLVVRYANERHNEWFGTPVAQMVGKTVREVMDDDAVFAQCEPYMQRALEGDTAEFEVEETFPDGKTRLLHARYMPQRAADGEVCGFLALVEDITERRQTADQLAHSQRIQAVGQLTGGVAHDFNNLLAVIQGNTEFLADSIGHNEHLDAIDQAAARGAELTQRLLAFSRQQPLRPEIVDVSATILVMGKLLKRTLGESIDIHVAAAPGTGTAMADSGQVENALLNLAINARDAMPDGGVLTIECANAHLDDAYVAANPEAQTGDYVAISVSDTGTGIPPDILPHVFEPFFTTKDVGEGTGLGLSMVYGFAQQSHGHAKIYSEVGTGSTVKLYLPRPVADAAAEGARAEDAAVSGEDVPRGRGEVVLVLEDDPDVRALTVNLLTGLGYTVLETEDAHKAEAVLSDADRVDVVLSDVVLPGGVSGPEFVEKALKQYPDIKALFMSGYTADATRNNGLLGGCAPLLNKPFRRADLAKAVRSVLSA